VNSEILLSICIPTYNRAGYLEKALESIVTQNSFNNTKIEVLVSDNASEDNTQDIAYKFQTKYPNIIYTRNPTNVGAERNIFKLLSSAKGDYIFLLTDDDILLPFALSKLMTIIVTKPECSVFLSSYEVFLEKRKRLDTRHTFKQSQYIYKNEIKKIVRFFNASSVASRICIKKEFLDLEGFKRHIDSMYPCMYLVGYAALNGLAFYIAEPLVRHIGENQIFWSYKTDYMLGYKIELIKDLGQFDKRFYPAALSYFLNNDIPSSIIEVIVKHRNQLPTLIKAINSNQIFQAHPLLWIIIIWRVIWLFCGIIIRKLVRLSKNWVYKFS